MTKEQEQEIKLNWSGSYFSKKPESEHALLMFEKDFYPIPADLRWLLRECGAGGTVESISDISQLRRLHQKFNREKKSGHWTLLKGVFCIGSDRGGNPFGIEESTGRIVLQDHDFGGLHELAPSFYSFLRQQIEFDPDSL